MIGGGQGVPRRDLREPAAGSSSRAGSAADGAPFDSISHPHASGTPLPAAAGAGSQRQLHFTNTPGVVVDTSGIGAGTPTRPGAGLGAVPSARQPQYSSATTGVHPSPDPAHPISGPNVQRELELLWKALDEERHVVKMKSEVINSLEQHLQSEKSRRIQLEGERDALKETIANMRSQVQLGGGGGGGSPSSSVAFAEQSTNLFMKRPVQMPIGFSNFSGGQTGMHRRAAAAAALSGAGGADNNMPPETRAHLAAEYLETELNETLNAMSKLQRNACFAMTDAETHSRNQLADSAALAFETIAVLMRREQRATLVLDEARQRGSDVALSWAAATVDRAADAAKDREDSAVKYFKGSFTRLEKELFVNMQDLARAANRTSEHHAQMLRCVENYSEHLQNLHYQCAFELFRGESSIVRWREALNTAAWAWPRWWERAQELYEQRAMEASDLFVQSAKLLIQQEGALRSRAATNSLLRQADGGSSSSLFASSGGGGGGGGGDDSANGGTPDEFFERIRHLEGRLAQKSRLIGLHVKRIQELEDENDAIRSGGGGGGYRESRQLPNNSNYNNHNNRSATPPPSSSGIPDSSDNAGSGNTPHSRYRSLSGIAQRARGSSQYTGGGGGGMSVTERQMLRLYEQWQEGVHAIVIEMHDELLTAIRPWARVPRALLAQMQAMALRNAQDQSLMMNSSGNYNNAKSPGKESDAEFHSDGSVAVTGATGTALAKALDGTSPASAAAKSGKTLFIRGLSRTDMREHQEYETQAMAASLVASPDAAFDAAQQTSATKALSGSRQALLNHFYNYVSMTLLDEAREYSVTLLRQHDDLVSAFHKLRPVVRQVDVIKVSLMEGALSLAEAQRDQALTSSHWIHTQAEQAVQTLRTLVGKADEVASENKSMSVEEAANQARAQAAARRLEEVGAVNPAGMGGGGGGVHNAAAMQDVVQAFDNIQASQSAMNDPEMLENQRLAEDFATKCNLLVNRASFLYRRLMEREQDVDVLSRRLAEVEVRDGETRESTDASIVVQILEREIADDALVMLREAMLEERNTAQESIRTLLNECQERNYAIRDLQRQLAVALKSCRFLVGMAMHAQHSWDCLHGEYVEMGRKLLRVERAKLLPPISEVALQMFVAHFEYLDTMLQSHSNFLEQAHEAEHNVDALMQRRKVYEREMLEMGQEMFRLNQESRLAKQSVKAMEQWAFNFVTESCTFIQGINASAFTSVTKDLAEAYGEMDRMKAMLPKNYVDVSERLELERFERGAFEERARLLEAKLTRATTESIESQHDLNETRDVCQKLDRLRNELESNNRELELLLLQEREAAESLREKNMEVTEELSVVRNELVSVKRALMTEAEAHNATIRNLSSAQRRGT